MARRRGLAWSGSRAALVGLAIATVLLLAFLASQLLQHRIPFGADGSPRDVRIALVHFLLVGYAPAAFLYLLARSRQAVAQLRPALEPGDPAMERLAGSVGVYPLPALLAAITVGLAMGWAGPYLSGSGPPHPWNPATWIPEVIWHRVVGPVVGVGIALLALAATIESVRLSRLAAWLRPLDVFRLEPLAPFAQQGLTNALLLMGVLSLAGLFVVDQGITPLLVLLGGLTLVLAVIALALPVRGAHLRIRAAKAAELAWCDQALRRERDRLRGGADAEGGRLADVVAYRSLVDGVREWPFDEPARLRIALYLLIPLASWLLSNIAWQFLERRLFAGGG